jgi:catechol 2,3-dioxygenase-like lactoylglutathione lyase family enzyme
MKRVTGIGGVFFKSKDPKALGAWYKTHLGIEVEAWGGAAFRWRGADNPEGVGTTVWSPFSADTTYFAPSTAPFMINYRVEDLHAVLAALRAEGVEVEAKVEESEYGKFGWVMDPDGNKLELWQPPLGQ